MELVLGDCKEKLKELDDNSIDAIVTDPPYGLSFMGKKWDYDVPSIEVWQECLRVLKPGGYLLSFAGTRTQHRMAVNIEDAGFEIRDMIAWVYGSGFPKSLNIGKAVDKLQGGERIPYEREDFVKRSNKIEQRKSQCICGEKGKYTKGFSDWEGWGTALKPALEPITVARKPLEKGLTIAENCLKWGVGGINIDGCRVGTEEKLGRQASSTTMFGNGKMTKEDVIDNSNAAGGRFPANLIHDGSDEVVGLFPNNKSSDAVRKNSVCPTYWGTNGIYGKGNAHDKIKSQFYLSYGYSDSGSASRFFYCAKASKRERNIGLNSSAIIMVKYSICKDKSTTPEEREVRLLVVMDTSQERVIGVSGIESKNVLEWSTVLFGKELMEKYQKDIGFTTKTGTNLTTTSLILNWLIHLLTKEYTLDVSCEMENGTSPAVNVEKCNTLITTINEKMASALGVKNVVPGTQLRINVKEGSNFHSTVKPIALMEYLVKLVSREGQVVLDPFMGSGTTGMACKRLDREFIGIEMMEEYMEIAKARIDGVKKREQLNLLKDNK